MSHVNDDVLRFINDLFRRGEIGRDFARKLYEARSAAILRKREEAALVQRIRKPRKLKDGGTWAGVGRG